MVTRWWKEQLQNNACVAAFDFSRRARMEREMLTSARWMLAAVAGSLSAQKVSHAKGALRRGVRVASQLTARTHSMSLLSPESPLADSAADSHWCTDLRRLLRLLLSLVREAEDVGQRLTMHFSRTLETLHTTTTAPSGHAGGRTEEAAAKNDERE